uniref:Uncharacterized protein n=1 Tax=viral metagenome TaxID=1070528 RepID=A0A6C0EK97_9ZZZZ
MSKPVLRVVQTVYICGRKDSEYETFLGKAKNNVKYTGSVLIDKVRGESDSGSIWTYNYDPNYVQMEKKVSGKERRYVFTDKETGTFLTSDWE